MISALVVAAIVILTLTNMATLGYGLYRARWVHRHVFTEWSEWVRSLRYSYSSNEYQAVRFRSCDECGHVQRQVAGDHNCSFTKLSACPHLDGLMERGKQQRIARLEKELGL